MTVGVQPLAIPEVLIVSPDKHDDQRGFLSETYSKPHMAELGVGIDFVQDNHSFSISKGTLRGLHFQSSPFAQAKLVRVVRGAIFDVAVDIRVGSPTFGRYVSKLISADAWNQIFVPTGFAHGFVTLEPQTEVIYKVSSRYSPEHDKGLLWNDPDIGIDWPVSEAEAVLSDKDKGLPMLSQLPDYFHYERSRSKS
ncbi:dTDP-4-dehydrorhamnose 3,5-epimerase [Methyloceanibacter stevinii]|uniref:dTDP-4-dehydrorhamnose 3,5-epimerase n=1 Tax=Methyloceanibacter stevinii TaxID=1774970 RepID=A0A1E3VQT4_9HYPH|nr:dTDP-4-dehydrorhamnose 3,5-epimerase [Methyloceanibacter stevinii]ODR95889.1 dTDP-4-dehydrorhamnose 3,5-epimerase [Methyloceanibacter stevinii]